MKYTSQITIDKPINEVIDLFDNPDNLCEWMEGLESFEHISGEAGQVDAKSRLVFKMGKRDIEMIETILVRNLPTEFIATYEANGVFNIIRASFEPISENKTTYITEQEFEFKGFMKIMGFLMPGLFKKQTMKHLVAFKAFAEKQDSFQVS